MTGQDDARPSGEVGDDDVLTRPTERLLLVEDDDEFRALVELVLRQAGYEVVSHADGRAALDTAATQEFDMVISDVVLPGVDGIRLVKTMRERGLPTPVVLMSGETGLATALVAQRHDVARYLIKPFRLSTLLKVVDDTVFGRQSGAGTDP